jgi:hypothetical protein
MTMAWWRGKPWFKEEEFGGGRRNTSSPFGFSKFKIYYIFIIAFKRIVSFCFGDFDSLYAYGEDDELMHSQNLTLAGDD